MKLYLKSYIYIYIYNGIGGLNTVDWENTINES